MDAATSSPVIAPTSDVPIRSRLLGKGRGLHHMQRWKAYEKIPLHIMCVMA
eukprot:CAMPEP_0175183774 /NCGR_PEP_ID=MMETSP0093-20121207/1029_1 /TAXON_ID=311494 /ORGANISM="Alexandrium monilatum, Strain CCMP3105" /LENGTH=50 /DNA_ID=CAMNT_0016476435 /DNA_START=24 /DNA_END=176 /DNA_ORIENTATION=+